MALCLTGFVVGPRRDILDCFLRPAECLVPVAWDLGNILQAYLSKWLNTRKQWMRKRVRVWMQTLRDDGMVERNKPLEGDLVSGHPKPCNELNITPCHWGSCCISATSCSPVLPSHPWQVPCSEKPWGCGCPFLRHAPARAEPWSLWSTAFVRKRPRENLLVLLARLCFEVWVWAGGHMWQKPNYWP